MATARVSSDPPRMAIAFAREAALRGWPVFPVDVHKHPLTAHGHLDATADLATIDQWRDPPGYGIPTGPTTFLAIDVDAYKACCDPRTLGELPPTPTVKTGGGGLQYYFQYADFAVRNSAGKLGPGIDVRGDGGWVVGVGSLHASGQRYQFVSHPDDVPLAPLPEPLRERIRGLKRPKRTEDPAPTIPPHQARSAEGIVGYWLVQALKRAKPGTRNSVGSWLARQLGDHGVSREAAWGCLQCYQQAVTALCDTPYTLDEAKRSLTKAYQYPPRPPCLLTLSPPSAARVVPDPHLGDVRIRNNGVPELERHGSVTTPLEQDFPDYLEAAHAADALPTVGDLHHAHSPAHRRRMRQQEVIQHVWTSLWPGKVFGGPRLRSLMFHTTAAGYAGQECATLVMFFVQVFTNPDRQREIKHPIAYTLKCLKTAGIQTPYGERGAPPQ